MFYIIESDPQLEYLRDMAPKGAYVEVLTTNDNFHPTLSTPVAIYVRPLGEDQGYIIPVDHDEGLNVDKSRVYDILKTYRVLYVYDKKRLLYHLPLAGAIDLQMLLVMNSYGRIELPKTNSTYAWFYNKFPDFVDTGKIVPISKLYEKCEQNYTTVKHLIDLPIPPGFDFYNKTATYVFYLTELSGLRITYTEFLDLFKPNNPRYNIKDNIAYTYYNLYNITSRPTNAFNSVNFAAIPKAPEYRKAIIPQYDFFVEFDFDGYHLRLLCEQIGYELTNEPAHIQFAKLYFGKTEISDDEYQKAKQINFHAIYGKIPPEYAFLDVFEKIQKYINKLWKQFQEEGYVEDPISKRRFTKDLPEMHPQKLMNYMMQSLETSRNIVILKDVLQYLDTKKTKIALYTYDAIVFDFSKQDGKETLEELQEILNQKEKYPVKFKYNNNLVF